MIRPPVSVVVPFAGDAAQALVAVALLRSLATEPGDELIVADNCGAISSTTDDVTVVRADGEQSPARARNAGAARASADWILFLDADVQAPADLLSAYFAEPIGPAVGALAGEIVGAPGAGTVAARYGASRNFLGQSAHLSHPFRPRAAAANLMVRRAAFEQAEGFVEGVRAAEDTDFCWRLQELGWTLELRPRAAVAHAYRASLTDLRRQWRRYAAGRAWLASRYPGFTPQPAVRRALPAVSRAVRELLPPVPALLHPAPPPSAPAPPSAPPPTSALATAAGRPRPAARPNGWIERAEFLAIDAVLAIEELIGLRMSNRVKDRRS